MKYLILIIFLTIVWSIWKKRNRSESNDSPHQSVKAAEKMQICSQCSVHFPQSDGVADGAYRFCCDAHRRNFHEELD